MTTTIERFKSNSNIKYNIKKVSSIYNKQLTLIEDTKETLLEKGTVLVNKDSLDNVEMSISQLQNCLNLITKVIHQTRHYDHSTETWVGKTGYWLDKNF